MLSCLKHHRFATQTLALLMLALSALMNGSSAEPGAPTQSARGAGSQGKEGSNQQDELATQCANKLDYLLKNGKAAHPDPKPTVMSEAEIDAYLRSSHVVLPKGVSGLQFQGEPGVVTSDLKVDFDKLASTRGSSNLLLTLFAGTHSVQVISHAHATAGVVHAHVDSVSMDGMTVPRFLLSLYVEEFLKPKYPEASLDPTFKLPSRIQSATVGAHKLTLVQR